MSNTKEKAIELVEKFRVLFYGKNSNPSKNKAKQCALIAVNEIIELDYFSVEGRDFWNEVKKEIEKL